MIDRDSAATKLKLDIIPSSESQSNLLQNSTKKLKELGIPDPKTVRENAIDDVIQWPQVTSGSIFAYILKRKTLMEITYKNTKTRKPSHVSTVVFLADS